MCKCNGRESGKMLPASPRVFAPGKNLGDLCKGGEMIYAMTERLAREYGVDRDGCVQVPYLRELKEEFGE